MKPQKPWYRRKRFLIPLILLILFYFCFIPSRFHVSPETTGLQHPTLRDGKVDYFAALDETYSEPLKHPEQNGMRYCIAAFGPQVLELFYIPSESFSWSELLTNSETEERFKNFWVPLCEQMYIDPYRKPPFYDYKYPDFYKFSNTLDESYLMEKARLFQKADNTESQEEKDEEEISKEEAMQSLYQQVSSAPWTAEEYPEIADWVKQYNEPFDYFGMCVRQPYYACWRRREEMLSDILLPDVSMQRHFARSLSVRVCERLGRGDVEGAWYDVLSMLYLGRHYKAQNNFFVINLVGIHIENLGFEAAKLVLASPSLTGEMLQQFVEDLRKLPENTIMPDITAEMLSVQEFLNTTGQLPFWERLKFMSRLQSLSGPSSFSSWHWPAIISFDRNIAGKHLNDFIEQISGETGEKTLMSQKLHIQQNSESLYDKIEKSVTSPSLWRLLLIRTRSQLTAEIIIAHLFPTIDRMIASYDRSNTNGAMLELAIAIERYARDEGVYPENLDDLFPRYIKMVPLDFCTGRSTFVYKVTPDGKHPFRLYAYGPNGMDNGGTPMSTTCTSTRCTSTSEFDLVFW
ncbi:MAG: hypothetical protein ACRC10_09690 [Thermoguttaceae bacterium]